MQKILKIIAGVAAALFAAIKIYYYGKNQSKEEFLKEQAKQENEKLSKEVQNAERIARIERATCSVSADTSINGLRDTIIKDDNN